MSLTNTVSAQKVDKKCTSSLSKLRDMFETAFAKAVSKKLAKMTKDLLKEDSSRADFDEAYKAIDEK